MLHRHSQITWAALSGQGRDPCFVALTQRAAANSLYQRQRNVSQPCFTSCCIQFQEFGLNLQLPVVMRNDILCLNAAVCRDKSEIVSKKYEMTPGRKF